MKKYFYLFAQIFLITISATAQNPKTNAGKVTNKSPEVYQAPAIPAQPPQSFKKDTGYLTSPNTNNQDIDTIKSSSSTVKSNPDANDVLLSLGLIVGIPQNKFSDANNKNLGIGLGISIMHNFMGTDSKEKSLVNIYLGGTFEYLYFGGASNNYSYNDPYPYNAISNSVTTSVNINVYSLMIASRIEFFNGPVVPFIEVAAGGRWFDGNQKITVDRSLHGSGSLPPGITFTPTSNTINNHLESDYCGAYGYGGGLRIGNKSLKIELKLMYMNGSNGRYIDKESIKIDNNSNITYSTKTSTTDMLLPQISISGTF